VGLFRRAEEQVPKKIKVLKEKKTHVKKKDVDIIPASGYKVGKTRVLYAGTFAYTGYDWHVHRPIDAASPGWAFSYKGVILSHGAFDQKQRAVSWFCGRVDEFILRFGADDFKNELDICWAQGNQEIIDSTPAVKKRGDGAALKKWVAENRPKKVTE
jgi:hypothetical protein